MQSPPKKMRVILDIESTDLPSGKVKVELWKLVDNNFLVKMGLKKSGIQVVDLRVEDV